MRRLSLLFFTVLCIFHYGAEAQAVRYDNFASTTNSACAPRAECPILAIPGTRVIVCTGIQATATACAASPATTYTSSSGSIACPSVSQLTPSSGGACTSASSNQGNFGWWIAAGTYSYFITTPNGRTYGPSPFTVGGGGNSNLPSGLATQYLQIKPNVGAINTYRFNSLPTLQSSDYIFPAQTPGVSLSSGSNTITVSPVPLGVNGTDVGHYLYVSGGTGTAEPVLIAGGTAVSGSASGTLVIQGLNSHTGAWTITSATAGIQEAVDTSAIGKQVQVPSGNPNIYAPITVAQGQGNGVCIVGQGQLATILQWQGPTTGNVFYFDGPGSPGGFGASDCLENMQIQTSNTPNTNTALNVAMQVDLQVQNVNLISFKNAINVTGPTSQGNLFQNMKINGVTGDGVTIDTGLVAGIFDSLQIACTDTGLSSNGFHVKQDAGSIIRNSYVVGCGNDFIANPASGKSVTLTQLFDDYLDCNPGVGLSLNPAAGGIVVNIQIRGSVTACAGSDGVFTGATGTVTGVLIDSHISLINGHNGYNFTGGSDINLTDSYAMGNSVATTNTYDGLAVNGTVSGFKVNGGIYGDRWTNPNFQRYGISLAPGCSNVAVQNADVSANVSGAIHDTCVATEKLVSGNFGVPVTSIASASTVSLGANDSETVILTGSTDITAITADAGVWDERTVTFIKSDSGSVTVIGSTLTQGRNVVCQYNSGLTAWFCSSGSGSAGGAINLKLNGTTDATAVTSVNFTQGTCITQAVSQASTTGTVQTNIDTNACATNAALQAGTHLLVTLTSSSGTTFTGTMNPTLGTYTVGQVVHFIANAAVSGTPTLNIDTLGARPLVKADGTTPATATELPSGELVDLWYDGTSFRR